MDATEVRLSNETPGLPLQDNQTPEKGEVEPVVQGILQDSLLSTTDFESSTLLQSECYAGEDASITESCMSLPASTMLLTAKPFKSRIPVRRGGNTTPSDYDRMSNCSGRSTPTFHNGLETMTTSFPSSYINSIYDPKLDDSTSLATGTAPPSIAPKPSYVKGQLPRRLNKMSLRRETSLPPLALIAALSKNLTSKTTLNEPTTTNRGIPRPNYVRSNSSLSMYEERKKTRDQQQLQRLGYLPSQLSTSSRRGSVDNFYGGGGDLESASSTRCSTPNRLMGSMSKIPVWTGSQEKLEGLRNNNNTNGANTNYKNPTSNRILPPIPTRNAGPISNSKIGGAARIKKLATKKWESCSSLEVSIF